MGFSLYQEDAISTCTHDDKKRTPVHVAPHIQSAHGTNASPRSIHPSSPAKRTRHHITHSPLQSH